MRKKTEPSVHVHISNLAAQTGASLFSQINSPPPAFPSLSETTSTSSGLEERNEWWTYNKTENLSFEYLTSHEGRFTHLITESNLDADTTRGSEWKLVGIISGFERWSVDWELFNGKLGRKGELLRTPWCVLKMVQVEKLWVYERFGWDS